MVVPKIVKIRAKDLIELFGDQFMNIGKLENRIVYQFITPQNQCTGFPFIYLYDPVKDDAEEVTGFKAIDIIMHINESI